MKFLKLQADEDEGQTITKEIGLQVRPYKFFHTLDDFNECVFIWIPFHHLPLFLTSVSGYRVSHVNVFENSRNDWKLVTFALDRKKSSQSPW